MDLSSLDLCSIADTVDLKYTTKSLADALSHIGNQLPCKPMQSANFAIFGFTPDTKDILFDFDRDSCGDSSLELSFRSFQSYFPGLDDHFDSTGDGNGQLSNTRQSKPRSELPN
jgi:hypothetical protein